MRAHQVVFSNEKPDRVTCCHSLFASEKLWGRSIPPLLYSKIPLAEVLSILFHSGVFA
jgi:hypothetical protein